MGKPQGPLYEQEDGASGGGGSPVLEFKKALQSAAEKNKNIKARNTLVPVIGPNTAAGQTPDPFSQDIITAPEAPPPAPTEQKEAELGSRAASEQGDVNLWAQSDPLTPWMDKVKGKGSGSKTRLMGVIEPGKTAQEQVGDAYASERIMQKKRMVGFAYLQAGKVSQRVHQDMAELFAADSDEVYRLIDEEFPKFKEAQRKLQEDLEDIRSLRVNPYNYLQTSGRGGRAGAVLATWIGQMAAGAGGVNHARKALKNAIDRDIEAQATNIELQFKGVEAASKNIQDQIKLIEQEIFFRDKAQAYAWEAAHSVIKSALQGAANEATYLGLQVLGDYAQLQASAAAAALRAKQSSLYISEPVRNAKQMQKALQLGAMGLQALQQAFKTGQASAPVQPPVEKPDLRYADPAMQALYGQARQDVAPLAEGQPPATTEEPQASVKSRRPSRPRKPSGGGGFKPDMTFTKEEAGFEADMEFTPEEAGLQAATAVINKEESGVEASPEERQGVTREDMERAGKAKAQRIANYQAKYFDNPVRGLAAESELIRGGSEAIAKEEAQNRAVSRGPASRFKTIGEMVDSALSTPGIFFSSKGKRALTLSDAEKLRQGYEENSNMLNPKNAYIARHSELFEAPTNYDGISNSVRSTVFGRLHLRAIKEVRASTKTRDLINARVAETDYGIRTLRRAAKLIGEVQTGSLLGFRYDKEDGQMRWTRTDVSQTAALAELKELMDRLSVQWIKGLDPAGRLSDQDFTRAQEAIAKIQGSRMDQLVSWVDQAFSGGEASNIQKGLSAYFKSLALDMEKRLYDDIGGYVIQSPDAWEESKARTQKDAEWLHERLVEEGETPSPEAWNEKNKMNITE